MSKSGLPRDRAVSYDAVESSLATGDILIFHGASGESLTIEDKTHLPFSHAAMVVRPHPRKPPLVWQANPGAITKDTFTKTTHGGAQLALLRPALIDMSNPAYGDTPYLRRLRISRPPEFETVVMWAISGLDGTPFPKLQLLLKQWSLGAKKHVATTDTTFFCSELVAHTFMLLGLLPFDPPPNSYAPGDFSVEFFQRRGRRAVDHATALPWMRGASLGPQLRLIPPKAPAAPTKTKRS
jgi:hypothetical protein